MRSGDQLKQDFQSDGQKNRTMVRRFTLTLVVVLALEGKCVSFRVLLALLVCQVSVGVMVAEPWAVLVALPADWSTERSEVRGQR